MLAMMQAVGLTEMTQFGDSTGTFSLS
jgi:hypothetical protein